MVTTVTVVVTVSDTGVVVTGGRGTAFRGMSPMEITMGVAVDVTGGRGAGSGLMRLAIWSLSSTVRNPLAQSTRVEKRVFLPSTLISLNCSMSGSWSNRPLGQGGETGSLRQCIHVLDEVGKQVDTKHTVDLTSVPLHEV